MKKNKKIVIGIGMLLSLALSGCGDGSEDNGRPDVPPTREAVSETVLSDNERAILEYEQKLSSGECTAEDYKTLAGLYQQEGYIRKQRDMLEQCRRLYMDEDSFSALQEITVNAAEEGGAVLEEAQRLADNISLPEYQNEAMAMLLSPDWMTVMMPRLREGSRNYYLQNTESTLYIKAGYDEAGREYTNIWYLTADQKLHYLARSGDLMQMTTASLADGAFQGGFESWLCIASTGDSYHDTGTFENGIVVGDYTSQVSFGTEPVDAFVLWSTKVDLPTETYTGSFDVDGTTTLEQPDQDELKNTSGGTEDGTPIVYAYNENKSKYLFINKEEGNEEEKTVFDAALFGVEAYPVFTPYEPKAEDAGEENVVKQIESSDIKVRIFDNNIEWFDGSTWHIAGSVSEYAAQDPFRTYTQEGQSNPEGTEAGGEAPEEGADSSADVYGRRGGGTIVKQPPRTNTNRPQTPATPPTTPVTPSAPPETPATPTPPPATPDPPPADDDDDDDDNHGGDANPNPPNAGDGNDSNSDGGDANGGDVDIDWTPDIL